jgi:hypothetical protein
MVPPQPHQEAPVADVDLHLVPTLVLVGEHLTVHDVLVVVGQGTDDGLVTLDCGGGKEGLVVGSGGGITGEGEGGGEEEGDLGVGGDAVDLRVEI